MANLTADREYQTVAGETVRSSGVATTSTIVFKGSFLCWFSGLLARATDAVGATFAGIAIRNITPAWGGESSSAAGERVEFETGKLWIADAAAAQTDVGQLMYVQDDQVAVLTGGSVKKVIIGRCVDYKVEDGLKWRLIDTHDQAVIVGA